MELADVNILVQAFRLDGTNHQPARAWLDAAQSRGASYAVSEFVLSSFVRIVTNRRIFPNPSALPPALDFADGFRTHQNAVLIAPGPTHWSTFASLCRAVGVVGDLAPDAYLAALAIEAGCTVVTLEKDFARFPGLLWKRPS